MVLQLTVPVRAKKKKDLGKGKQINKSAALKVLKNTVVSIILKWKTFGTTRTLPRAGRPAKQSNRGEKDLGQGDDQEPDGHSGRAPEILCPDGRTFQKETISAALW